MSDTIRKKISFYAEPDVQAWYESLEPGEGSRMLNNLVKEHLGLIESASDKISQLEKRLARVEKQLPK